MNHIKQLSDLCQAINNLPQQGIRNINLSLINGVKHEKDIFRKVIPLKGDILNDKSLIYFVEIWDDETCLFRDYCVHEPGLGLDKMSENVSARIMTSIFASAMSWSDYIIGNMNKITGKA